MRKSLLIVGLVAITLMAAANDAFAQRRGGRGGRDGGRGGRGGVSIGVGGYYGYYGSPYYYGRGSYYPYYYSEDYAPGYYYSTPGYYDTNPTVQVPATDIRQSGYFDSNTATLKVLVPNPNAEVWFDDAPTAQRGMDRTFHTPPLQRAGTYSIRARWTENGRTMDQERRVRVQPGQSVMVDFRADQGERLPSPRP